jgi:hypothetical protein
VVTRPEAVASRTADALTAASAVGGIEVTVLDDAPLRFLVAAFRTALARAAGPGMPGG